MTRKDYIVLASAINRAMKAREGRAEEETGIRFVAYQIAQVLQQDNLRFNRDKFLIAANCYRG